MSATEDPSLMPGGQDPRLLRVPLSPSEGVDGVRESAAFLASEGLSRALLEKEGRQEAAQAAEKIWDVEMLEEEDEGEEVDEYQSPNFEYEFGNEEESDSEEGEANEEENEEEEEVIEPEEGNSQGQEHAEIAAGPPEAPMTRFWSLFRVLIHSLLHRIHDKDHVLIRPHAQYAQVEAQFYRDFHDLEKKYAAFYQPLFDKRSEIINAIHEPTEDVKILSRMIQKSDELVLEHLEDVKIKISGFEEPMSFTIEFIFKSNEYFFNKVLMKTYQLRSDPGDSDPFFSKGPEIISSTGCKIYWKGEKDVTVQTSKLQRGEVHRSFASTTRKMPGYSFFYFYPPDSPEGREMDVATDYKLGYFFREVLVPKSVLFFTNEARDYNYESADDDAREAGSEEKKEVIRNEKPDKRAGKDLDPEESSC
ncbi:nucleosome assembly protein 1-like 1 [Vulpes lagopus]|uniref:nucleosome assembly protein 1-like 1 n=1 Tax=Vulpes lagopus TaxID=494514 RepID=UPI001BC9B21C|nr:nucleosome assembly protein 1-like 1 [Vulpes lagopus]